VVSCMPNRFNPRKGTHGTHIKHSEYCGKYKFLCLYRELNPGPSVVQPVTSIYVTASPAESND